MKLPFYFSIDFEDQVYDVERAMGHTKPEIREEALYKSYERTCNLSDKYLDGKKMTFYEKDKPAFIFISAISRGLNKLKFQVSYPFLKNSYPEN